VILVFLFLLLNIGPLMVFKSFLYICNLTEEEGPGRRKNGEKRPGR
jgi:hypothetical protein